MGQQSPPALFPRESATVYCVCALGARTVSLNVFMIPKTINSPHRLK